MIAVTTKKTVRIPINLPYNCLINIAVLFSCLVIPISAHAEYHITYKGAVVETACFWIEKYRVYLCEGGQPLALSDISSIVAGQFSPLETEMHKDAVIRFRTYLSWLLGWEDELLRMDLQNIEGLKEIGLMDVSTFKKEGLSSLSKKHFEEITRLIAEVSSLERAWGEIRIPDRALLLPIEIKTLQMLTWRLSLNERRVFLDKGDPTYLEYTLEHMSQASTLRESFTKAFLKVTGGNLIP